MLNSRAIHIAVVSIIMLSLTEIVMEGVQILPASYRRSQAKRVESVALPTRVDSVCLSADESWIAFTETYGSPTMQGVPLQIVSWDGRTRRTLERVITSGELPYSSVDWSGTGRKLAYTVMDAGNPYGSVAVIRDRYSGSTSHMSALKVSWWPVWSPDSKLIAVLGNEHRIPNPGNGVPGLGIGAFVLSSHGSIVARSPKAGLARKGMPVWSPDGLKLIIPQQDREGFGPLAVWDLKRRRVQLPPGQIPYADPDVYATHRGFWMSKDCIAWNSWKGVFYADYRNLKARPLPVNGVIVDVMPLEDDRCRMAVCTSSNPDTARCACPFGITLLELVRDRSGRPWRTSRIAHLPGALLTTRDREFTLLPDVFVRWSRKYRNSVVYLGSDHRLVRQDVSTLGWVSH